MSIFEGMEPQSVLKFFEEISSIPHGSGNNLGISNYLVDFAKKRGLWVYQDELLNVIIKKSASAGYENEPTIIIQGHMDMVAVKDDDCDIDMTKEGLRLELDGDLIFARGTSLGADDGVAVAFGLAILASDDIKHPNIELVITVDEEIGLIGAAGLDASKLEGRSLINIDTEEDDELVAGCAGGIRVNIDADVSREGLRGGRVNILIHGLIGGHSGVKIHMGRANANLIMGRLLNALSDKVDYSLISLYGGQADNAIANECKASIVYKAEDRCYIDEVINKLQQALLREYRSKDEGIKIDVEYISENAIYQVISNEDLSKIILLLINMPNGVISMSSDVVGLVETSLNLGILRLEDDKVHLSYAVRSSVESAKEYMCATMKNLATYVGAKYSTTGGYPGWDYRSNSPLRDRLISVYRQINDDDIEVKIIHAGLECGIIASKIPDLDCVSIGVKMWDIHSTKERMSVESLGKVWRYLLAILEAKTE